MLKYVFKGSPHTPWVSVHKFKEAQHATRACCVDLAMNCATTNGISINQAAPGVCPCLCWSAKYLCTLLN